MKRLVSLEFHKLRGYRAFWILFALYFVSLGLAVGAFNGILDTFFTNEIPPEARNLGWNGWNLNAFPDSWHYLTYLAGFFHYILAVIIIILITNEFSYKTVRQNIIDGMSRTEWLLGKFLTMVLFATLSTLVVMVMILVLGATADDMPGDDDVFSKMPFILAYFVQLVGYMSFAFLIGMLVRRAGISIGIMFIYSWFLEKIAVYYSPESIEGYYPMEAFNRMIPFPFNFDFSMSNFEFSTLIVGVVWIGIFMGSAYLFLKRRDL